MYICVCIYIYIYTYLSLNKQTNKYIYIYINKHIYIYIYIYSIPLAAWVLRPAVRPSPKSRTTRNLRCRPRPRSSRDGSSTRLHARCHLLGSAQVRAGRQGAGSLRKELSQLFISASSSRLPGAAATRLAAVVRPGGRAAAATGLSGPANDNICFLFVMIMYNSYIYTIIIIIIIIHYYNCQRGTRLSEACK